MGQGKGLGRPTNRLERRENNEIKSGLKTRASLSMEVGNENRVGSHTYESGDFKVTNKTEVNMAEGTYVLAAGVDSGKFNTEKTFDRGAEWYEAKSKAAGMYLMLEKYGVVHFSNFKLNTESMKLFAKKMAGLADKSVTGFGNMVEYLLTTEGFTSDEIFDDGLNILLALQRAMEEVGLDGLSDGDLQKYINNAKDPANGKGLAAVMLVKGGSRFSTVLEKKEAKTAGGGGVARPPKDATKKGGSGVARPPKDATKKGGSGVSRPPKSPEVMSKFTETLAALKGAGFEFVHNEPTRPGQEVYVKFKSETDVKQRMELKINDDGTVGLKLQTAPTGRTALLDVPSISVSDLKAKLEAEPYVDNLQALKADLKNLPNQNPATVTEANPLYNLGNVDVLSATKLKLHIKNGKFEDAVSHKLYDIPDSVNAAVLVNLRAAPTGDNPGVYEVKSEDDSRSFGTYSSPEDMMKAVLPLVWAKLRQDGVITL